MKFPYAQHLGIEHLRHEKGKSHFQLKIKAYHFNPQQVVHGGVLYSLADTSMGSALYTLLDKGQLCATIEIKMSYFKPVTEGVLRCHTQVINKGKRIATMESEIWNQDRLVAKAMGSFSILSLVKN